MGCCVSRNSHSAPWLEGVKAVTGAKRLPTIGVFGTNRPMVTAATLDG
jgi:hypothetical protein